MPKAALYAALMQPLSERKADFPSRHPNAATVAFKGSGQRLLAVSMDVGWAAFVKLEHDPEKACTRAGRCVKRFSLGQTQKHLPGDHVQSRTEMRDGD
jgi:hypothetical protein